MKHTVELYRIEEGKLPIEWAMGKYVTDTSNGKVYIGVKSCKGEIDWVSVENGCCWGGSKLDNDFIELKSGDSFTVEIDNS